MGADVVVSDLVAAAPALAAEVAGVPNATLIPTLFPVQGAGLPPWADGLIAPRTADRRGGVAGRRAGARPCGRPRSGFARVPGLIGDARVAARGSRPSTRARRHHLRDRSATGSRSSRPSPSSSTRARGPPGRTSRADALRAPAPRRRAAVRRRPTRPRRLQHRPRPRRRADPHARSPRWSPSRCAWWRRSTRRGERWPARAGERRGRRLALLRAGHAGGGARRHDRRPRNRRPLAGGGASRCSSGPPGPTPARTGRASPGPARGCRSRVGYRAARASRRGPTLPADPRFATRAGGDRRLGARQRRRAGRGADARRGLRAAGRRRRPRRTAPPRAGGPRRATPPRGR